MWAIEDKPRTDHAGIDVGSAYARTHKAYTSMSDTDNLAARMPMKKRRWGKKIARTETPFRGFRGARHVCTAFGAQKAATRAVERRAEARLFPATPTALCINSLVPVHRNRVDGKVWSGHKIPLLHDIPKVITPLDTSSGSSLNFKRATRT